MVVSGRDFMQAVAKAVVVDGQVSRLFAVDVAAPLDGLLQLRLHCYVTQEQAAKIFAALQQHGEGVGKSS